MKTVSSIVDFSKPICLTPEMEAELCALDAMPDSAIDLSDIPDLSKHTGWKTGSLRERIAQRRKEQQAAEAALAEAPITVSLEADVLEFFRERGEATPKRINEVLREYAQAHRKSG